MSDRRLRQLERRAKETGSPEDAAAWLRERVRSGGLTKARLLLAGYAGHEAAQLVLDTKIDVPTDLRSWARTVALEVPGWRVSAWLLGAALQETIRHYAAVIYRPQSCERRAFNTVASYTGLVLNAADVNCWAAVVQEIPTVEGLIQQHAARELIWDGESRGFIAHLALRMYEILSLERWGHTGEIADRCAQSVTRFRTHHSLPEIRNKMREAMCRFLAERALNTTGDLNDKYMPMSPLAFTIPASEVHPDILKKIIDRESA